MKDGDYKLIPMSEITDEAREMAVAWMKCEDKHWIGQKHKLASDIMNYAKKHTKDYLATDFEIEAKFPVLSHHQMDTESWNNRLRQEGAKWLRDKM